MSELNVHVRCIDSCSNGIIKLHDERTSFVFLTDKSMYVQSRMRL
jgi:hypothetical protein